jgi:hypothetical protein
VSTVDPDSTTRPAPGSDEEDLLLRLRREHRDAAGLLAAIQRRTGSEAGGAVDTVRELITDLVQHSVAERQHLLPLVRQYLPDGDAAAERIIAGQERLERELKLLEQLPVRGEFWIHLRIVENLVSQHAGEVERSVFTPLAAAVPADELQKLGRRAAQTSRIAPTHPHPHSPREGAALAAAAPGAGLVDRVRDLFS